MGAPSAWARRAVPLVAAFLLVPAALAANPQPRRALSVEYFSDLPLPAPSLFNGALNR